MRDQSLRGHVHNLEQEGELVGFTAEVDPHANVSALGWKTYDRRGKASLFSNLDGFPGWRMCNQIIADRRKWAISLGLEADALIPALSSPYLHPKLAIAVDDGIDASDLGQVFWSPTTRVHAERDVARIPNTRIWSLDNVSDMVPGMGAMYRIGAKMIIDATKPAPTRPADRARFERARPLNHDDVELRDFLPWRLSEYPVDSVDSCDGVGCVVIQDHHEHDLALLAG